ncbi:C-4 sterol methyl oxidase [Sorochytrium milnesiophthora]
MPGTSLPTAVSRKTMETQWLNNLWADLFRDRNQLVVLTAVSFLVHEISYYGRYIPFWIAGKIRALDKYRIQEDKQITDAQWWKCIRGVLFAHWCIELPMMLGFHPTAKLLGMKVAETPLPSWTTIAVQTFLFMVFEDFFHYWAHRLLHEFPKLYRVVHKQHHEFAAPFGLAAEYAHPFEILILSMGTFLGPLIYTAVVGDFHVFTMLLWSVVRTLQAVEAHSGYDFPWSLNHIVPFWSGADHHDYHHQAFTGNYATSFRWWDHLFGTEGNYRATRAKQAAAKKLKYGATAKKVN